MNKMRDEKDHKIAELNALLKNQNRTHREALQNMKTDNENFARK